ncbi:MAG: G3E family GTPase [Gammaproteobacteria bacterium]
MIDAALIPITVLTGFLGAGKTTVLNGLLRHPQLRNTAVIVNEFGDIGLDHLLVRAADENVVLLDAGCLCCTINSSLRETLGDLWLGRVRDELPLFDRVLVETTGLAEPGPIMQAITRDPFVTDHYRLDGTVTCVDAVHLMSQLQRQVEVVHQIAVADRLILTKADRVSLAEADAVAARLATLNPAARVLRRQHGEVTPGDVLGVGLLDAHSGHANALRWLHADAYAPQTHTGHEHGNDHGHDHSDGHSSRHSTDIRAHCLRIDFPVSWAGLAAWCELMGETHGDALLRVKGIIGIAEIGKPVVVHGVHRVFDAPVRLPEWPDADTTSRLVVICRDLDEAYLRKTLAILRLPRGSGRPLNLSSAVAQAH